MASQTLHWLMPGDVFSLDSSLCSAKTLTNKRKEATPFHHHFIKYFVNSVKFSA